MAAGRSSTGISPRPILMGAPRNALRAFNAGVSLSCLCILAHMLPHLFHGLVLSLACLVGVPSCGPCNRVMAHRPDRLHTDRSYPSAYAARRLFFVKVGSVPGIGKRGKGKPLAFCQGAERIRRASRPGSVGFPDSASCGYPRTHEGSRPCHREYGYTGGLI